MTGTGWNFDLVIIGHLTFFFLGQRSLKNFTERRFQCEFDRPDNCGFIDVTLNSHKWIRRLSDNYGKYKPYIYISLLLAAALLFRCSDSIWNRAEKSIRVNDSSLVLGINRI